MISNSKVSVNSNEYTYRKGAEIFGEREPAAYVYQVKTGAVRSYKLLSDGRRLIGAFHLVGDIFGLERDGVHRFTAEALVETTVRLIRRQSLETMADTDAIVTGILLGVISKGLEHAENHLLLLGRNSALEKVAAFLIEMDDRLIAAEAMTLPMSRRDIADYLGLTIETVSRVLTHLHRAGVLKFCGKSRREIVVRNRQRLTAFDLLTGKSSLWKGPVRQAEY
jgi:CRP/FNR family nitrogen fixation transcriptional regulator